MRPRISFALLLAALVPAGAAPRPVDFDREIRPILSDNCFTCHGPDEKQRMVKLRLDTKEGAFADRGGYRVIVPGDAAGSRLYQRISAPDKAQRMPPPMANRTLTAAQVDLIRRWIAEGAKWEQHWAFLPPLRPALPDRKEQGLAAKSHRRVHPRAPGTGGPEAFAAGRPRHPAAPRDARPDRPAADARGGRRFPADRSPDAYETVVDRLLASPRYGERMAMEWLDVARYADTHGYHIDSHRDMWPWRDWVIRAFNHNMPFDQFTTEQLAGDLLPDATLEQKIATGFNRNHMINFEGGAIPEEYQNEYVVDRVETTSAALLGLTMGCARCHDHKYDPISAEGVLPLLRFLQQHRREGAGRTQGQRRAVARAALPRAESRTRPAERHNPGPRGRTPRGRHSRVCRRSWEKTRLASLPPPPLAGLLAHYELDGSLSGHLRPLPPRPHAGGHGGIPARRGGQGGGFRWRDMGRVRRRGLRPRRCVHAGVLAQAHRPRGIGGDAEDRGCRRPPRLRTAAG